MNSFLTEAPFAHRGLHDDSVCENSLPAFQAAVDGGWGIETDIHLTKDGIPVLFHDDSLERMTDVTRLVEETDRQTLGALRLTGTGDKIPLLSDLLALVNGKVPLLLELKPHRNHTGKEVALAVSQALAGYKGDYAVQSFHPFYSKAFKNLSPQTPCGVLGAKSLGKGAGIVKPFVAARMPFNFYTQPDFINYRLGDYPSSCTEKFGGIKLAYTVRSAAEEETALKYAENFVFEGYTPTKNRT